MTLKSTKNEPAVTLEPIPGALEPIPGVRTALSDLYLEQLLHNRPDKVRGLLSTPLLSSLLLSTPLYSSPLLSTPLLSSLLLSTPLLSSLLLSGCCRVSHAQAVA